MPPPIAPDRFWQTQIIPYDQVKQVTQDGRQQKRQEARDQQLDRDRKAIVRAMGKYPAGETKNILKAAAGFSGERFNRVLASLIDDGTVVPTSIMKAGRKTPFPGFRLAETANQL